MASSQRPIADGVFTWPSDAPRLLGSRCDDCACVTFPTQQGCPRCGSEAMAVVELSERGTLWTWTTQDFVPKEPYTGPEEPFLVGYVELSDGVRVETRLVDVTRDDVEIGMAMELRIVPFRTEADGTEVLAYAFAPAAA